ncbi:hypothetical protein [Prevotella lacticifex]|uniref:Uncharacterized protein n=1 Tax=Prevotella lacticifex TaxID=2854755 RepID=A0A9R1CAC8_9BACT|nr:hypothetical protein [Prevotella lacticifex]GJG35766.1 hypothetical protein PRLR5003_09230 [Prevotella lacticifex]GJG39185.1 hypothetical protein PRLR5019_11560 [Prevotella lacticifex]GJG42135.1 hypothetical protein PRLR5025_09210 [Prevotella lacticifex]GJG45539.1 hypothetical protein PRLR5027_11340 [Prevotella lacticifex]GJG48486.1 hypothetical protein PRLR5052_08990 [Prevotella lacticifex]
MQISLNSSELLVICEEIVKVHQNEEKNSSRFCYDGEVKVKINDIMFTAEYYFCEAISEEETDELGIAEVKTDNEDVYVTFKDTDEEFAMGIARLQALQKTLNYHAQH